uniref:CRAL/TRIO N-terminal domain-containing protein n=1 Tax=Kalanchoe fedtschenkoi TaxID=63787 RepID=A0A7N0UHW0_KALFE
MSTDLKQSSIDNHDCSLTADEQLHRIGEVRNLLGDVPDKLSTFCSDGTISRYLRARNWNIKKAAAMLKDSMKWRLEYKPEEIRWEDVAHEGETGKVYRSKYFDKYGRPVLVMRPSRQMVKPFLEPKTYRKVKFVYPNDLNSKSIMEELFDMEQVESAFGGNDEEGFEISKYAERMRQDDLKIPLFWTRYDLGSSVPQLALVTPIAQKSDSDSEPSKMHPAQNSPSHKEDSERLVNEIQNGLK